MERKFDFIIFGAAGFTGRYTVEAWIEYVSKRGQFANHTWAVAEKYHSSGKKILEYISEITGVNVRDVDILVADATDLSTILPMTEKCSLLINCVGPFRFYGENVVRACLATGTHCIDVSGEAQYLMQMQKKYHEEAKEKGIYLIGSCGFDSIPADCGTTMLQQNFQGDLNSVEMFYEYKTNGYPKRLNYGTWKSEIHIFANIQEWRDLEKAMFYGVPESSYKLISRGILHYNQDQQGWCVPFPQCDASVVRRSQQYFFKYENQRPVQIQTYMKAPLFTCGKAGVIGAIVLGLSRFSLGIQLLEKHPKIFSLGTCSRSGPTRESAEALEFKFVLVGNGWDRTTSDTSIPPNKTTSLIVSGKNPGYGATGKMLLQAALTVLNERQLLPNNGGVYTPGVAFAKSTLIDRLNAEGVKFEIQC